MTGILAPSPPSPPPAPLGSPPTFAIVITAYQAADTIARAVESALAQTHAADEVIVVDDGSTDDLASALAPYAAGITLVTKENGGGASARNAGVEATTSDFMAVLDADDAYHPKRLEVLAQLATLRPDLDLITTDARFVVDGEGVGRFLGHNEFSTGDQRLAIFECCFVGGWPAIRLEALRAVGGFDERMRIAYDWDCWLRMILAGSSAGCVDLPYYDYVLHSGSLAASRIKSLWERVRLLEHAAENPSLRASEKPALERETRRRRDDAVREEISAADRPRRRRCLALAGMTGLGMRTRALCLIAAVSPSAIDRILERRDPPEKRFAKGDA